MSSRIAQALQIADIQNASKNQCSQLSDNASFLLTFSSHSIIYNYKHAFDEISRARYPRTYEWILKI